MFLPEFKPTVHDGGDRWVLDEADDTNVDSAVWVVPKDYSNAPEPHQYMESLLFSEWVDSLAPASAAEAREVLAEVEKRWR